MFAQRERPASPAIWFGLLCLYLVATRWPLAPRYLYYFDSANFALALEHFDPALHQPQPPGYPLFVGLTRLIHLFVLSAERVFLIAGLLAAAAAVALIFTLAREMFGNPAGVLSAALLASNPVFWFGGITNQIRLFLAVSALAVSWMAWRAVRNPDRPRWLYLMFAALAVCGGFRPALPLMLVPLVLWTWWRCGHQPRRLVFGMATAAGTALPWLAATVWAVGGPARYVQVIWQYANEQFHGSSAVFGAPAPSAIQMARMAVAWNLLGVIAWIWAVPYVVRGVRNPAWRERATFLAIAFLPAFLFSALIHIGDPDQALATVSILCLAGGGVLAAFCRSRATAPVRRVTAAVVALQTLIFFVPPTKLAKASSYRAVAAVDRMTTGAVTSIEALHDGGPLTIVHYGSSVASRQLAYYFPDDYVVVLPASSSERAQVWHEHRPIEAAPAGLVYLPQTTTRVVCLLPWYSKGAELPGWEKRGSVYTHKVGGVDSPKIGGFTLIRHSS
jgi:4-amino-4-deoxy-L-arabinose transferase-like glycosyltransferase